MRNFVTGFLDPNLECRGSDIEVCEDKGEYMCAKNIRTIDSFNPRLSSHLINSYCSDEQILQYNDNGDVIGTRLGYNF